MSQNGDDAEVRDAMINPVQRRESSASRFLKHFRPDRNNPAYHSEGKGLRKRRNWTSERQLVTSDNPAGSTAPDPPPQRSNQNQPQRSHSFSEPDGPIVRPSSKENSGGSGVRESFRWRFNTKSSKSEQQGPKGGDTSKMPVLTRTKSDGLPSSGNGCGDSCQPPPPPAAPARWHSHAAARLWWARSIWVGPVWCVN